MFCRKMAIPTTYSEVYLAGKLDSWYIDCHMHIDNTVLQCFGVLASPITKHKPQKTTALLLNTGVGFIVCQWTDDSFLITLYCECSDIKIAWKKSDFIEEGRGCVLSTETPYHLHRNSGTMIATS